VVAKKLASGVLASHWESHFWDAHPPIPFQISSPLHQETLATTFEGFKAAPEHLQLNIWRASRTNRFNVRPETLESIQVVSHKF